MFLIHSWCSSACRGRGSVCCPETVHQRSWNSSRWLWVTTSPQHQQTDFLTGSGPPARRLRASVRSSWRYERCTCAAVMGWKIQTMPGKKKSESDTDMWFCAGMLLIRWLMMKGGHRAAPSDPHQLLPSAFSPSCLCFRHPSTTTSLSPSQMNWCRRKRRGRLIRWTQRPPLMCSGKSKTHVDPLDDFISRNSEQIRLKTVCNVIFLHAGLCWSSTMPSHGWHALLPRKTVSPACLSTWLFWSKCTMPSWTCFSQVRWRTELWKPSCSSYFWTTDGSGAPLWGADADLRGKERTGKSAVRQNAGFACACYLRHRFEKQFVTSNPASVDKSPENFWANLWLFQRRSACFSFYPIWKPPGTRCYATSRTAWPHQQNMFFFTWRTLLQFCTELHCWASAVWLMKRGKCPHSKGEACDNGTFFSRLPKCWTHEHDGQLDRIVVYSVIRTFAKCWDLFLIFKRTKWDTSTWPFFPPIYLQLGFEIYKMSF